MEEGDDDANLRSTAGAYEKNDDLDPYFQDIDCDEKNTIVDQPKLTAVLIGKKAIGGAPYSKMAKRQLKKDDRDFVQEFTSIVGDEVKARKYLDEFKKYDSAGEVNKNKILTSLL